MSRKCTHMFLFVLFCLFVFILFFKVILKRNCHFRWQACRSLYNSVIRYRSWTFSLSPFFTTSTIQKPNGNFVRFSVVISFRLASFILGTLTRICFINRRRLKTIDKSYFSFFSFRINLIKAHSRVVKCLIILYLERSKFRRRRASFTNL